MKKLLFVATAVLLCVGMALPAAAEVKVSGMAWFDIYVRDIDSFRAANGVTGVPPLTTDLDGQKDLQMNLPTGLNRITASYVSSKADYGAAVSITTGKINHWDDSLDVHGSAALWWKPMPNVKIEMGDIPQVVGGLSPSINLGFNEYYRGERFDMVSLDVRTPYQGANARSGFVPGYITFGNLSTSNKQGVAIDYTVNDMVTIRLGIMDPDDDGSDLNVRTGKLRSTWGGTANMQQRLPRIDLAVPIKFGNFYVQPKGGWLKNNFENVGPNAGGGSQDDSFTTWVLGIDASVVLGPVKISAEYAYGENMGGTNFTTSSNSWAPTLYLDADGNTKISDVKETMWWAEISWMATKKVTLIGNYSWFKTDNDVNPANPNDNWIFTRFMYGIALRYAIAPNFFVMPAWTHTDYGDDNDLGLAAGGAVANFRQNSGTLDLYGVSFYMVF